MMHVNSALFIHNTHHHFSFSSRCVFVKRQPSLLDCKLLEGNGCILVHIADPEANTVLGIHKMLIRYLLNKQMKQTWLTNQKQFKICNPCLCIEFLLDIQETGNGGVFLGRRNSGVGFRGWREAYSLFYSFQTVWVFNNQSNIKCGPDLCASVGWALSHKVNDRQFNSFLVRAHAWTAGLIPGRGVYEGQLINVSLSHQYFSLSLSPSLPLSLKINKILKKRFYWFIFRERGREGERKGEKHQCVVASCMFPTEDLACNPSMCPDWQLNQWPLASQASTQSTEPQQPGQ